MSMPAAYQAMRDDSVNPLHVAFNPGQEVVELRWLLDRALNCLSPRDTPAWALELDRHLNRRISTGAGA